MVSSFLVLALLSQYVEAVLGLVIVARELRPAILNVRASFYGGWSISSTTCPPFAPTVCFEHACCPKGTYCDIDGLGGASACCPDKNSCSSTIISLPICANQTWTMFQGASHPFCCLPGYVGVLPADNYGQGVCAQPGVPVPQSLVATKLVPQATGSVSNPENTVTGSIPTDGSSSGGTSSGSGSSSGSESGGTSAGQSNGSSNSTSKKSGLSTAAIGGIVGGVVALIIVGCIAFYFGVRRGRKQTQPSQAQHFNAGPPVPPPAPVSQMQGNPSTQYYNQMSPSSQGPYAPPLPQLLEPNKDVMNMQQQRREQITELGPQGQGDKWVTPHPSEMDPGRYSTPATRHEMQ